MNKKGLFSIIGAILGIPMSYYFQSEMVRSKMGGIGGYLQHFDQIVNDSTLLGNVFFSVIIFAGVGLAIGYVIDENEAKIIKAKDIDSEEQTNFCPSCGEKVEDKETKFCENCGSKL